MRANEKGHVRKLSLSLCPAKVTATPQVPCKSGEVVRKIQEIKKAVSLRDYAPPKPTSKNMAIMMDYIVN